MFSGGDSRAFVLCGTSPDEEQPLVDGVPNEDQPVIEGHMVKEQDEKARSSELIGIDGGWQQCRREKWESRFVLKFVCRTLIGLMHELAPELVLPWC